MPLAPLFQKQLSLPGFNASIIPTANGYTGLTRVCKQHEQRGVYPEATNECVLFHLDSHFNTLSQQTLTDATGRQHHRSWTQGIEDARILSPSIFTAVTCDTNPRWKPEVSLISFQSPKITTITPLFLNGTQGQPQKNWLFIRKHTEDLHDYLYSSFPFHFVRVNTRTGEATTIQQYDSPPGYSNITSHNGAITPIDGGDSYLLTVRIKQGYSYHYSLWILLDSSLQIKSISKPFRFIKDKHTNDDGGYSPGGYEMCMSLHTEGPELVACVSVDDEASYIQKYNLQELLVEIAK